MKRIRDWTAVLVVVSASATVAYAQLTLPAENHYKLYTTSAPLSLSGHGVVLTDQFGTFAIEPGSYERFGFANPTAKTHDGVTYPILDPVAHQMWWRFTYPPTQPSRTVLVTDQFGTGMVTLGNPLFLVNPALKNPPVPPPPPPVRNHYVCYSVIGSQPLNKAVTLVDQWGTRSYVVVTPRLLCNPVQKYDSATNTNYPVIDPKAHLMCYEIRETVPGPMNNVTASDQFGVWTFQVLPGTLLCVPALKDNPVSNRSSTWGQIKALYH